MDDERSVDKILKEFSPEIRPYIPSVFKKILNNHNENIHSSWYYPLYESDVSNSLIIHELERLKYIGDGRELKIGNESVFVINPEKLEDIKLVVKYRGPKNI